MFKWYVMAMAWALRCVCVHAFLKATPARITRAVSKPSATMRNVSSQQEAVGLSASQLPLNASLTNRAVGLHATADNTATLLTFILLFPCFKKKKNRHSTSQWQKEKDILVEDAAYVEADICSFIVMFTFVFPRCCCCLW